MEAIKKRKATFTLSEDTLENIRKMVAEGKVSSGNAFVQEAIELKLKSLREADIGIAFAEAAQDPDFLADLHQSMVDFEAVDAESSQWLRVD